MLKLENPGVIVLVSVLSGCVILWTLPVAFIGIILSLIIVIYTCATLVIGERSLVTRHACFLRDYVAAAGVEFGVFINYISLETSGYVQQLLTTLKSIYRENLVIKMERYRRQNAYQLSSESLPSCPGELNTIKNLSPIPNKSIRISQSENNIYARRNSAAYENARAFDKLTSTPMTWKHREGNGAISGDSRLTHRQVNKSDLSTSLTDSQTEEGQDSSPWGTSISPKIRCRAAGIKTVQTVAGPLLASTRYNIDTKTYSDVTSPGLTSRLTKYATEANSKLIHSPYATGQFPRVNLNSNPTPFINSKTGKMRLPVTVRVAPPDTKCSPPERQRILSDICHVETSKPPSHSVAQVLRDISLKRHASRDDIAAEMVKKQRTEDLYGDGLENLEEMTQKRGRDESSRSEEDISVDISSMRPTKRTKKPSCYDIINSLSSSTNVTSGVKRKADISRSGSPEIGKHFKSYDSNQATPESPTTTTDLKKVTNLISDRNSSLEVQMIPPKSPESHVSPKSSPKGSPLPEVSKVDDTFEEEQNIKITVPVKLTDRLFMREEPQNIEKLKSFIDEHSALVPKFSGGDEIKKSDIVNMRQTSMKARLKSMFDAISGKTSNTIDPSVVIQAEAVSSTSPLASLNSTTSTTNVNTSPIATSAIAPIIGKSKTIDTPGKRVTFNLPADTSITSLSQLGGQAEAKTEEEPKKSPLPLFSPPSTAAATTVSFGSSTSSTTTSSAVSKTLTASGFNPTPKSATSTPVLFGSPQTTSTGSSTNSAVSISMSQTSTPSAVKSTPTFSFGVTSTPGTSAAASTAAQNTISMFSQTNPHSVTSSSASTSTNLLGSPKAAPTTTAITTSAPVAASTFVFGAGTSLDSALKPAGFSSGVPSTTADGATTSSQSVTETSTTTSSTVSFSFGVPKSIPTFGNSTTSLASATPSLSFGTSSSSTIATAFGGTSSVTTSFGGSAATNPAADSKIATTQSTGFSFGTNSTTTAPSTTSSGFSFVSMTNKPAFSFGGTGNASQKTEGSTLPAFGTTTTATPAFGTIKTSDAALGTTSSTPAFGTTTTKTISAPTFGSITSTPTFGTTSIPAFGTTSTLTFGTPSTSVSQFGTLSTATPAFGTPSTNAAEIGGPSSNKPTIASQNQTSSTTAFGISSTTTPVPAFGAQSTSSFGSTASPLFGNQGSQSGIQTTISFGTPKTTAPPAFGTTTASTTPSLFNGANTNTTSSSSSFSSGPPVFGQVKSPPAFGTPATTSSIAFGTPATTTSSAFGGFGTTSASLFGTNTINTSSFGAANSSAPTFGNQTPGQAVPTFGTVSNSGPSFGTTSAATTFGTPTGSVFGTPSTSTPAFNSATPTFGATTSAPSTFGTMTTSTPSFGAIATTSSFTPTTSAPAFGSTGFGGFGKLGNASNNAASPFGSATPTFGNTSTPITAAPAYSPPSTSFSFGGSAATAAPSQPQQPQQAQQNSIFTFGGSSANSSNGGFQFGGTTTPQSGAFNFSSSSAAPATSNVPSFSVPNFGAQSGGSMFSIGSGSTAPRSRSTRQARRQR